MKEKNLISDKDFVRNPVSETYNDSLPLFELSKSDDQNKEKRGCLNYGIYLATKYANQKAAPILNAICDFYFNDRGTEKHEKANEFLKQIAMQYYERD